MNLIKKIIVLIYIIFFTYLNFGSELGPTKEEIFMSDFVKALYTFNNKSTLNLDNYQDSYPHDIYSLELKNLMTENAFNEFKKRSTQHNFIIDGYVLGYVSTVSNINIKLLNSASNNITFNFKCNVELNYIHKSKKEVYKLSGEATISKFHDGYKISKIIKIKFPSNVAFPTVYKFI